MKTKQNKQDFDLLADLPSYEVIKAAAAGDIEAVNLVRKYYEPYITVLASKVFYDEQGNEHYGIDMELKSRMETKLILSLSKFKPYILA